MKNVEPLTPIRFLSASAELNARGLPPWCHLDPADPADRRAPETSEPYQSKITSLIWDPNALGCLCGKSGSLSLSLSLPLSMVDVRVGTAIHLPVWEKQCVASLGALPLIDDIYDRARLSDPKSTPSKLTLPVCPKAASAATSHTSGPFLYSLPKILTTLQGPFKTGLLIHESGCQETSGSVPF